MSLFVCQAGSPIVKANAVQGLIHPTRGITMNMSIQLYGPHHYTLALHFKLEIAVRSGP